MLALKTNELQQRANDLIRNAEQGHMSVVTKEGRPLFVTVPASERLEEAGVFEAIAVKLVAEGALSLSQGAHLARQAVEEFLDTLAAAEVDVVDYPAHELADELAAFG